MRREVLRPIRQLSRAVKRLERGELGAQVDASSRDELGLLARQFNAGHPSALLRSPKGDVSPLASTMPILLGYTEGLVEVADEQRRMRDDGELGALLEAGAGSPLDEGVRRILTRREAVMSSGSQVDVVTVVLAEYRPSPEAAT